MNDTATPSVSVIIPTYNHGRFLGRALQSVLDQTYTNWEAIVIDNHSTDNTDEVMASITDPRITCLKIQNNGVIAASRNAGIRAAKSAWVAFLDSDDWWMANKLEACIDRINDQVDLVYHDMEIIRNPPALFKKRNLKTRQLATPVLIDLLVSRNIICNSSVVIRKNVLAQVGNINEDTELIGSEDYNTWLRVARATDNFLHVPRVLGYYMVHDNNISKKNIYSSWMSSVAEFKHLLSQDQKNSLNSDSGYLNGRYKYSRGLNEEALKELRDCLKYASNGIRVRAIITIILIRIRLLLIGKYF